MVEIREISDARSEERFYRCSLPVTLRRRAEDLQLLTSDVSFQGAFIRTDESPPVNSLVRLMFTIPPDNAALALSAHVVKIVKHGDAKDQYPGFHARFMGLNGHFKDRWETLIWSLKRDHKHSVYTTVSFARPSYVDLVQQHVPEGATLRFKPGSVEQMARLVAEDIPGGTLFIPSQEDANDGLPERPMPEPGTKVSIELVHPVTDATVVLHGVVRRRAGAGYDAGGESDGVLVSLAALSDEGYDALRELVRSVHIDKDYDFELFEAPFLRAPPGSRR